MKNPVSLKARFGVHLFILSVCFLLGISCDQAPETVFTSGKSIFDKIGHDSIVQVTIEADFDLIIAQKNEETYLPASISYVEANGNVLKKKIKVCARGVTRKKLCDFPPLKIRFSKKDLRSYDLEDFHTLKLVTHCLEEPGSEQLLFKEYLAYRLYNIITDKSFQVQLVKVKYVDSKNHHPPQDKYAFLIENHKEMADRIQGELIKEDNYQLKTIDEENYNQLTVFQYMVGNTDWNLSEQHNIKLVMPASKNVPYAIPYDFDYSGLVNAPYARPYANLPIENVRERFFQWRGKNQEGLQLTFELFLSKRNELLAACEEFKLLDEEVKTDVLNYLHSFFALLNEGKIISS